MDPITIVVVKFIASALAPTAQEIVRDGYHGLKAYLVRQYGDPVAVPLAALEADPASPARQHELSAALAASGAADDADLLRLTEDLRRLVESPFAAEEDPALRVERATRRAGTETLSSVMDRHVVGVVRARSTYRVADAQLLRDGLPGSPLPQGDRDALGSLHATIRAVIDRVATLIEDGKRAEVEAALAALPISRAERDRAQELLAADRLLRISYQSLQSTIEFFSAFNDESLARINTMTQDPQKMSGAMLGNAVLLYELADFVIDYLEGFSPAGVDRIGRLRAEVEDEFSAVAREAEELTAMTMRDAVAPGVRERTLADIADRQAGVETARAEWDRYVTDVNDTCAALENVRQMVPSLEVIRANARAQISVLRLVSLINVFKQNSEAVRGTMDELSSFRLAPLTSNRVRRLLSIG